MLRYRPESDEKVFGLSRRHLLAACIFGENMSKLHTSQREAQ